MQSIVASRHGQDARGPIPDKLVRAIVAVEDQRFYAHHGIDMRGVSRAAFGLLRGQRGDQGGSTISQQLAKRLYGGGDGIATTVSQVGLALKLEMKYDKKQILEMYLETAYFGDGQWGSEAACATYFRKTCDRLDWGEASLLAGLLQAPSRYDPTRHFTLARVRQRHVLDRLVAAGGLTRTQADVAFAELTTLDK